MKKLISIVAALALTSCATTTSAPVEDPHQDLTFEKVAKYCRPANVWNVGVLGNAAMIAVFEHCLEVDQLLLVTAPVFEENEKLSTSIVEVVHLSYIAYLNDTSKDKIYTTIVLNQTERTHPGEEKAQSHITFYSIESTKKTK
jgi:hypothetical protein